MSAQGFGGSRKRRNIEQSGGIGAEKRKLLEKECVPTRTVREMASTLPRKKLSYSDYTVAWICALPLELRAAVLMLDEEHEALPVAPSDDNVYTLGSIGGHNIVVTSLRAGVYGLTSATAAGKDIVATFPRAVSIPLLVGIGGGVPSATHDIRLGDVILSDSMTGKTGINGQLEIRGYSNKPAPVLLNAVANIQGRNDSIGEQIQNHISRARQKSGVNIENPGADLDKLYEPECVHITNESVCSTCGPLGLVERKPRISPEVHFGPIASGNQVIKHARTRDRLAEAYRFLCFEMEAAGLMDYLLCLVIRGISDYCDSFKNDHFQPYSAFTAAAFARERLLTLPQKKTEPQPVDGILKDKPPTHQEIIMNALKYRGADTRKAAIRMPHSETCKWLFKQQAYVDWCDKEKSTKDYGLLWIKGKPGIGKSTIMKFILDDIEEHRLQNDVVISFFFNARGDSLEKSVEGLYRSLIVQLLTQLPDLHHLFDAIRQPIDGKRFALESLVQLFRSAVLSVHHQRIICLVDALDECPEEEIRHMVDNFVDLVSSLSNDRTIRILFSSRHYPNISINTGQYFVLEKQDGHARDLVQYIEAELRIGSTEHAKRLKSNISDRSNGIFLWVVLVVHILRREYDRGRVFDIAQRLNKIPTELDELFRDILLRDSNNLTELLWCLQWILYSGRPLEREEFYFAMLAGNDNIDIAYWNQEEVPSGLIDNFILDCSKGLVEVTLGALPVVQFIHESVREFLQTPGTLLSLWDGFRSIDQAHSHQRLRNCCQRLLSSAALTKLNLLDKLMIAKGYDFVEVRETITEYLPFLEYAVSFVLHHANEAQRTGQDQIDFLRAFNGIRWLRLHNFVPGHVKPQLEQFPYGILEHLAFENYQHLFECWIEVCPSDEQSIQTLLAKCKQFGNFEAGKFVVQRQVQKLYSNTDDKDLFYLDALVVLLADLCTSPFALPCEAFSNVLQLIYQWYQEPTITLVQNALKSAALMKRSIALKTILESHSRLCTEIQFEDYRSLLKQVFRYPRPQRMMDDKKWETSHLDTTGNNDSVITMMRTSLDTDANACIEILVKRGARLEDIGHPVEVMDWAGMDLVRSLLIYDSRWFIQSRCAAGMTPLHRAILRNCGTAYLEMLLHHGADVNAKNCLGDTPLHYCLESSNFRTDLIQLLINHGAELVWDEPTKKLLATGKRGSDLKEIRMMTPETPCCGLGK